MPAHSRPKDGVPSHAYVAGIHVFSAMTKDVDSRDKFTTGPAFGRTRLPGHDGEKYQSETTLR